MNASDDFATMMLVKTNLPEILREARNPLNIGTVMTLNPALCRLVEPGTPPPLQRLRVMQQVAEVSALVEIAVRADQEAR